MASTFVHDAHRHIGLMPAFDRGGRFEDDGEAVTRDLLAEVGWEPARAERAGRAVREHWDGPEDEGDVESLLLAYGTSVDVGGWRLDDFASTTLEAFLEAVNKDDRIRTWWYMAQIHAERLGMSDHSWVHMQIVLNISLRLSRLLTKGGVEPAMVTDHGMKPRDAEVVIAGGALLHDGETARAIADLDRACSAGLESGCRGVQFARARAQQAPAQ
jgi:hypothetical protein